MHSFQKEVYALLCFSVFVFVTEVEKLLVKQKDTKKGKGKKEKKKTATNNHSSDGETTMTKDPDVDKKNKESRHGKGKTSTLKRIANSLQHGPPPAPPARPHHKEQKEGKELKEEKKQKEHKDEKGRQEEEKESKELEKPQVFKTQQNPPMLNVIKELGLRSTLKRTNKEAEKNLAGQSGDKIQEDGQETHTGSHGERPTAPQEPQTEQPQAPFLQRQLPPTPGKELKPARAPEKPGVVRSKSADIVDTKPRGDTSPVPRPRNRPPPPPPAHPASTTPSSAPSESGQAATSSTLSSEEKQSGDALTPMLKPRPMPRPRPRGRLGSTGSVKDSQQEEDTERTEQTPPFVKLRPVQLPSNKENLSSSPVHVPRRPSAGSKPTHQAPAVPESSEQTQAVGRGRGSASGAGVHKLTPRGTKPTVPMNKPLPMGPKPRPPVKPVIPRKVPVTPSSDRNDVNLSPRAIEILQLSEKGQGRAQEILSLTDARSMDNSECNLLQLIDDFKKISFEVVESSSSLSDSLGPQGRFKVRRVVTNLESKYSEMASLVDTVGSHPTTVDMEMIGKAVAGLSNALDEICTTLRSTAS